MRRLLAPTWGPPHSAAAPFPLSKGARPHGSIMAFRVAAQAKGAPPVLDPAWISGDMNVPEPPVVANGVVFALSSGEDVQHVDENGNNRGTAERAKGSGHAVLHALDAETGKELFSCAEVISSFTHFGGIFLSNGRIFVTSYDGTVYAFGIKNEER